MTKPKTGPRKPHDPTPQIGLPGLRVQEVARHCTTEVYCADCDWVQNQSNWGNYHRIDADRIRQHLAANPGHTIEARMRGLERFTLDHSRV